MQIYKQWLEDNRENLRDSTSGQLSRLLNRAEGKVGEVDSQLSEYVGDLCTGGESAREAKEALETLRKGKRMVMKEAVQTIVHSWKGEGKSLPFLSYGGGTKVSWVRERRVVCVQRYLNVFQCLSNKYLLFQVVIPVQEVNITNDTSFNFNEWQLMFLVLTHVKQ